MTVNDGAKGDKGDKGAKGDTGAKGADGIGVPSGGSAGQVLAKKSDTDYDTEWITGGSGGGAVDSVNGKTGTVVLSTSDLENDSGYITSSALPVVPTNVSSFTNDAGYITTSDISGKQNIALSSAISIGGQTADEVESALQLLKHGIQEVDNSKQDTLTFDNTPTSDSNNPVKSGGIYPALQGKVSTSSVGVSSGIAELDANGKVPQSQLPSYVDDVVDGYYKEADGKFYEESTYETEITGEDGKNYISVDTSVQYRWTGSAFSALGGALTLGETSSTAYRGDRGKIAYDDSQANKTAIGDMSDLTTTADDLVGAINEVSENIPDPITAGNGIDITNNVVSSTTPQFVGTTAEWTALSAADKAKYTLVNLTDDAETIGTQYIDLKSYLTSDFTADEVYYIGSGKSGSIVFNSLQYVGESTLPVRNVSILKDLPFNTKTTIVGLICNGSTTTTPDFKTIMEVYTNINGDFVKGHVCSTEQTGAANIGYGYVPVYLAD